MELWAGIVGDPIVKRGKATVFGRDENPINFESTKDVAHFVAVAPLDSSLSRMALDIGGPENLTMNELVLLIERAIGQKAAVKHVPTSMMRLSRLLIRPFRPDVAGMIEAGMVMDTSDMSLDVTELRRRFPEAELTSVAQVIGPRFATNGWAA